MGIFNELKVLTMTEEIFCKKMQIEFPLSKKDRENIESNIKLFKYGLWRNIRGTLWRYVNGVQGVSRMESNLHDGL